MSISGRWKKICRRSSVGKEHIVTAVRGSLGRQGCRFRTKLVGKLTLGKALKLGQVGGMVAEEYVLLDIVLVIAEDWEGGTAITEESLSRRRRVGR